MKHALKPAKMGRQLVALMRQVEEVTDSMLDLVAEDKRNPIEKFSSLRLNTAAVFLLITALGKICTMHHAFVRGKGRRYTGMGFDHHATYFKRMNIDGKRAAHMKAPSRCAKCKNGNLLHYCAHLLPQQRLIGGKKCLLCWVKDILNDKKKID